MAHAYGKSVVRQYIAYDNDEPVRVASFDSAYLFETQPSDADAKAGTGAVVGTILGDISDASPFTISYILPAVEDPNPSSTREARTYWEVINYYLEELGQIQTDYRQIEYSRALGGESVPGTTIDDLKVLFPHLSSYLSDPRLEEILAFAESELESDIELQGIEYERAYGLNRTKLALSYLSIALFAEGQFKLTQNDSWLVIADRYRKFYAQQLEKVKLGVDLDGDGTIDSTQSASIGFIDASR